MAVVPTHTLADGEYDDVVTGRLAGFGFALQVTSTAAASSAGVTQEGSPVPTTTVAGTVRLPGTEVPPVLDAGLVQPLLASADERWPADAMLAVTGRLVVEPYLWAADGMLWPLLPDGRAHVVGRPHPPHRGGGHRGAGEPARAVRARARSDLPSRPRGH